MWVCLRLHFTLRYDYRISTIVSSSLLCYVRRIDSIHEFENNDKSSSRSKNCSDRLDWSKVQSTYLLYCYTLQAHWLRRIYRYVETIGFYNNLNFKYEKKKNVLRTTNLNRLFVILSKIIIIMFAKHY